MEKKTRGTIYAVGMGPGDPELVTQKAVRLIRECDVIAVPGKKAEEARAYRIAQAAVPQISEKELLAVEMPMTKDPAVLRKAHMKGARILEGYLDEGRNVAYLTIGDPGIYCTFSYLGRILKEDGYEVETVPGVPSFCAAAAAMNEPIAEGGEQIHILPAVYAEDLEPDLPGTYILMKSAGSMAQVKEALKRSGRRVYAVENCGMEDERIFYTAEEIPDDVGYLTLIIAKEK